MFKFEYSDLKLGRRGHRVKECCTDSEGSEVKVKLCSGSVGSPGSRICSLRIWVAVSWLV